MSTRATALTDIIDVAKDYEKRVGDLVSENLFDNSQLFNSDSDYGVDEDDDYGGDQGDMYHNRSGWDVPLFDFRLFQDGKIFDYVRSYDRFKDYSDDQVAKLLEKINSGCGYVAMANSIFAQYESNPEEFERVFGFPMRDSNGKFDTNRLILDFFCNTDDTYYLNESGGTNALLQDVLGDYASHPEDFKADFGAELWKDPKARTYTDEAIQAVLDRYQDQSEVIIPSEDGGTTNYSLQNRLSHYLSERGVNYECTIDRGPMTAQEVRTKLDSGYCVNLGTAGNIINLYDENGNVLYDNLGGHRMTVTGVTDDGNYIVSSWGDKYIVHPNELTNGPNWVFMDVIQ